MKRRGIMVVVAGAVAVWGATPLAVASAANARAVSAAIGTVSTAGTWGNAIEVPGLGTLNAGGSAEVPSISCASASNCVAGGSYFNGSGHSQAFVVRKVKGTWGTPKNVPGLATLNTGMAETLLAVSCASAGNCAIGGSYVDVSRRGQAYVDSERNGTWGKAIEVPGSGTLNVDGFAQITSMSCPSAGNCTAGGFYEDASSHAQPFVASEVNGTWGNAIEVPGSGTLNAGGSAFVEAVSCPTAGHCTASGIYKDGSGHQQGFLVSQT